MTMDLMYGCGSEYDPTLEELLEVDLRSEMDRIIAAANGHPFEFMTELEYSTGHGEEGIDEIDIRFDASRFDPFSLSSFGLNPSPKSKPQMASLKNNNNISRANNNHHHHHHNTVSNSVNNLKNSQSSSSPIPVKKVIGNIHSRNIYVNTPISSSHKHSPTTIVASIGSLSMGGLATLEETIGTLVDPSSVVPVSVTNSTASSASESDVDLTEFPTDEDESESEFQNTTNTVWVVPRQASSRSPSPNEVPEFELDEPEFILTTGSLDEVVPPKKRKQKHEPQPHTDGKIYPKPAFSYSCLIAMSLKNSKTGSLPVSEIYKFMCDHFPYFKSAPSGWKNSVRHNLSLNKCFEKIEKPGNGARKGCLWALNPAKIHKMDEEVQKWLRKDPLAIRRAMSDPENLELIERGELKRDYSGNGASDEDDEEDISEPCTPLTQAQLLARRSRGNSSDSMGDTTMSSTTPTTTVSQVQAITLSRPIEQKIHVKSEPMDTLDFGTITNVQGNYLCHTGAGTGTYTLSFSTMNNATTPIIIRRTPVK